MCARSKMSQIAHDGGGGEGCTMKEATVCQTGQLERLQQNSGATHRRWRWWWRRWWRRGAVRSESAVSAEIDGKMA